MNDRLDRRNKLKYAVLFALMLCVTLELAVRGALWWRGHGFFDSADQFRSVFFTMKWEPQPTIDDDGYFFHDLFVSKVKRADEVRILFFGGSTTVNQRAGLRFSDLLEKRLDDSFSDVDVKCLNAASDGYSTAQTLVNFSLRCLDAQPDVIVVYHNINDLSANYFGQNVSSDYSNKYKTSAYLGYQHRGGFSGLIMQKSRLARYLAYSVGAETHPRRYPFNQMQVDFSRGIDVFRRNLRNIVAISHANLIRVVLVTQAARSDVRQHSGFELYNSQVSKLAAESDRVALVDAARALTSDEYFLDEVHFTPQGVASMADTLFPVLKETVGQIVLP